MRALFLATLLSLHTLWQQYHETVEAALSHSMYSAPVLHTNGRGRPRFVITRGQLEYLRSLLFSWTQIASLLGVSRMTVYRRRGLLDEETTNVLDDNELDEVLCDLCRELPYIGESLVMGRMHAMGHRVSRERIRESIHRTDPFNTALRWGGSLRSCRPYSVPGPNSLWHIGETNIIIFDVGIYCCII